MKFLRHTIAALALAIVPAGFAGAATYFTGDVTKVATDLYEGPSGELINTVACAQAASATPALVRIDTNAGAVIGRITFGGVAGCDIAAVYAPYVDAPAGTYAAVLTKFDDGYYSDTTIEPFWIVRGAPTCPAATSTPSYVTLSANGATYVPPGTTLGTITFSPGASQQACNLVGVFGKVDLSTITAYTLSVTKDGPGTGSVTSVPAAIDCGATCSADFGPDTDVTLIATPSAGSTFAGWSGACSGSGACNVTMSNAADVTATFLVEAPATFSLSVSKNGTGTGSVGSSPAGIACGATCSANFNAGAIVTLTATADAGSTFAGWSGAGCAGVMPCDITMDAAKNVTATFDIDVPVTFALTVTRIGTGSGAVTSTPAGIDCGTTCTFAFTSGQSVTLQAVADAGSLFAGWSGACTGTGACNVTMSAARSVTATFANAAPVTFTLTVVRAGNGTGSVASTSAGIDCGTTCQADYPARTVVTLNATPSAGSVFAGWSGGGCTGTSACNVSMDAAKIVTATFTVQSFALTVSKAGAGSGTVTSNPAGINCGATCNASFNAGAMVTLTAAASAGSTFTGWSGGGCSGTGTCQVTMNSAQAVTATFAVQQFALTVLKTGGGGGLVTSTPSGIDCGATCNANFNSGVVVALGAAPSADSFFAGWSGGGCTGTGACNVTMDAAKSVTATFKLNTTIPRLANIATRMQVLTGADVLIGGFIIGGSQAKTVVVRARGPSLTAAGVPGALQNPLLQLFSGQTVIAANDDWQQAPNAAALQSSGFAPADPKESAILTTLTPGAYTAIVSGVGNTTGVGIVEVFEVDLPQVPLINIATRGQVLTGADVMIGGFIIQGDAPQTVIVRARGPSLTAAGVPGALQDPVLQLFSGQTQIGVNDDWQTDPNAGQIQTRGFAPADARESAILVTLPPGAYTAIVTGKNGTTGVGIIEVFAQ